MPKAKTHKGTARRFSITGTGKLMRTKGGKSHNRRKKAYRAKGLFDEMLTVSRVDRAGVKRLLPYGLP